MSGAFAWSVMYGINPDFMCHRLSINTRVKPVVQKRRKFVGEKKGDCRGREASECGLY